MPTDVGSNIKNIRKKQKKTLKNLSDITGFSISFLSQLENGKSSATLESLKKISLALNVEPGSFFNDSHEDNNLIHHNKIIKSHPNKQKIHYQSLYNSIKNAIFFPHLVTLEPMQNKGNLIKHPGQEFIYVLEGELTIKINNETHILNYSDSIMFDSNKEHYWYNFTKKPVKFLSINYEY